MPGIGILSPYLLQNARMAPKKDLYELVFGPAYGLVVIPLAIGGAISVALANQFALGYALFLLSGIWLIGHWLIAEPVKERRRLLRVFRTRPEYLPVKRDYWIWVAGGTIVIALLTISAEVWTKHTRNDFERDQVSSDLKVQFDGTDAGDPMQANFTLSNGSSFPISKRHVLWCGINLLVGSNRILVEGPILVQTSLHRWVISDIPHVTMRTSFPIGPHGDGFTDSCLSAITFKDSQLLCGDIFVNLSYYLEDQPELEDHGVRFVYVRNPSGNSSWHEQSQNSSEDFCYPYLDPDQKRERDKEIADPRRPRPFHS
jgi:hypothetical protein